MTNLYFLFIESLLGAVLAGYIIVVGLIPLPLLYLCSILVLQKYLHEKIYSYRWGYVKFQCFIIKSWKI